MTGRVGRLLPLLPYEDREQFSSPSTGGEARLRQSRVPVALPLQLELAVVRVGSLARPPLPPTSQETYIVRGGIAGLLI